MATVWYIHHLQYRFGVYLPSRARWSLWCPGCFQSTDSWLQEMELNTKHPFYCHIRCTMTPSMRAGVYKVYILLGREGEFATICSATCECSAGYAIETRFLSCLNADFLYNRLSASCTHVSAVLQALTNIKSVPFNLTSQ